jgi:hypothetical protein
MLFTQTLKRSPAPEIDRLSLDDLSGAVWVQAYNTAWLGRRWSELEKMFEPDVTMRLSDFAQPIVGREAVLSHLRTALDRMHVHEYRVADLKGWPSGSVGIITYRWQCDCTVAGERRLRVGRDTLILKPRAPAWQLTWCGHTVRQSPGGANVDSG